MGFHSRGGRLGSTLNKTKKWRECFGNGAGWEWLEGELLRENIRVKGNSGYIDLAGFLLKAGSVTRYHLGGRGVEEPSYQSG